MRVELKTPGTFERTADGELRFFNDKGDEIFAFDGNDIAFMRLARVAAEIAHQKATGQI